MIHTRQGKKTLEDQETVFGTFKDVYKRTILRGHVTDEYFDKLGYPKDVDVNGRIVERLSESDHLQRAKQPNHEYQLAKREKRRKEQIEKVAKKASEMRVSLLQILE
jgi:hypothetical protein